MSSPPEPDGRAGGRLSPQAVFEMMLAYKTTALLRAGLELGVFDALASGSAPAEEIAAKLGLHERGARLLLNALAAIRLLESDGVSYTLDDSAADLLVRGRPGYVGDMAKVMASAWEWDALQRLPEAVRRGGPVVGEHAETPGYTYWEDFATFASAVARPASERAAHALAPWASARERLHVLDIACGHGLYGFTLAQRQRHARVWSLDWPNVLPIARGNGERLGVADRVSTIAGDMFEVPLGGPYDVVFITNVLHHFSEARGVDLLKRAGAAMASDGRIVLVGLTVDDGPPACDPAPHLFSILMLVWTFEGEVHSVASYEGMLRAAGFGAPALHDVPSLPLRVIVADRVTATEG